MNPEQQLLDKWHNLPLEKQQQVLQFIEFLEFKDRPKSPEELGWQPGFFESTAGCLADDPLVRYPQGEYEERKSLAGCLSAPEDLSTNKDYFKGFGQ